MTELPTNDTRLVGSLLAHAGLVFLAGIQRVPTISRILDDLEVEELPRAA